MPIRQKVGLKYELSSNIKSCFQKKRQKKLATLNGKNRTKDASILPVSINGSESDLVSFSYTIEQFSINGFEIVNDFIKLFSFVVVH